ncbi:predicted protein [Postia placenta Mad-698-R]|nr:predicted protein [Postia placenta Mad-698-R]
MDTHEPSSSSSDTLPSAPSHSRSTPSRSQHSSPPPAPRRARKDAQHDRVRESAWGRSKLLSRLLTREERDVAQVRTMLALTSERLAHETRRADDAEARIADVLHKFRAARETALHAQADAARAAEEVRLYKLRLDEAQREIFRAQDVVDRLEADRADAEAEAARARTLARRYKEERLVARAREEGRQQGFQEGGRDVGYYEARAGRERPRQRQYQYRRTPVVAEEYSEEYEMHDNDNDNDDDNGSGSQPEEIVPIPRSPQPTWRPPSRPSDSRATQRSPPRATNTTVSVSDGSPIAAPSPIRPPSRPPAATPEPIPIQDPGRSRSRVRNEGPIVPVPVHNPVPSPSHPPVDVPPDNYIPYMSSDHIMTLPPPHELARPVAPRSPSPGAARDDPGVRSRDDLGVRSRDFAYAHDGAPAQAQTHRAFSNPNAPFSPQSRTSTNISQYDLVSARTGRSTAGSGSGSGGGGRDALAGLRQMIGAVRPQSRSERSRVRERERERAAREEDVPEPVRRERESSLERQRRSGAGTPLERLFKKRFRTRQSGSRGGVPDIMVESPTTATASRTSTVAAANQPHLLSPEMHQQTLPPPADDADFSDPRPLPPLPEFYLTTPSAVGVSDASEQQLPAGFVPMSADDFPDDPAMQFASPKPLAGAKGPTYEVAPIPPGVVYPDPPGRRSATPGRRSATPGRRSATPHAVALPPSPSSTPSPRRRRGSLSGHLSPLSLPLAFVASPSSRAPSD